MATGVITGDFTGGLGLNIGGNVPPELFIKSPNSLNLDAATHSFFCLFGLNLRFQPQQAFTMLKPATVEMDHAVAAQESIEFLGRFS